MRSSSDAKIETAELQVTLGIFPPDALTPSFCTWTCIWRSFYLTRGYECPILIYIIGSIYIYLRIIFSVVIILLYQQLHCYTNDLFCSSDLFIAFFLRFCKSSLVFFTCVRIYLCSWLYALCFMGMRCYNSGSYFKLLGDN